MITMKMARVGAGMTMAEMAEKLGVHTLTYGKWEKNPEAMRVADAKLFCSIVGIPASDIFFSTDSN